MDAEEKIADNSYLAAALNMPTFEKSKQIRIDSIISNFKAKKVSDSIINNINSNNNNQVEFDKCDILINENSVKHIKEPQNNNHNEELENYDNNKRNNNNDNNDNKKNRIEKTINSIRKKYNKKTADLIKGSDSTNLSASLLISSNPPEDMAINNYNNNNNNNNKNNNNNNIKNDNNNEDKNNQTDELFVTNLPKKIINNNLFNEENIKHQKIQISPSRKSYNNNLAINQLKRRSVLNKINNAKSLIFGSNSNVTPSFDNHTNTLSDMKVKFYNIEQAIISAIKSENFNSLLLAQIDQIKSFNHYFDIDTIITIDEEINNENSLGSSSSLLGSITLSDIQYMLEKSLTKNESIKSSNNSGDNENLPGIGSQVRNRNFSTGNSETGVASFGDDISDIFVSLSFLLTTTFAVKLNEIINNNKTLIVKLSEAKGKISELNAKVDNKENKIYDLYNEIDRLVVTNLDLEETLSYHRLAANRVNSLENQLEALQLERNSLFNELKQYEEQEEQLLFERNHHNNSQYNRASRTTYETSPNRLYKNKKSIKKADQVMNNVKELSELSVSDLTLLFKTDLSSLSTVEADLEAFCCKVKAAKEEINKIQPELSSKNDGNCCICLDNPKSVLLMPCRHLCVCSNCISVPNLIRLCPVCRGEVKEFITVFS